MDVSGRVSQYAGAMSAALDVVSVVGCALSVVCLALSLFVFTFFTWVFGFVEDTLHTGNKEHSAVRVSKRLVNGVKGRKWVVEPPPSLSSPTCSRSLYNVRNTIHRNLCLSLIIAELVFMIGTL